jgi:outer membrane protein OmpA-like peptidoglycan-associated protein
MKKSIFLTLAITLGTLWMTLVTGCAPDAKSHSADGSLDGALPIDSLNSTSIMGDTGISQSSRPEGINPETDVDYSVLASEVVYFNYDSFSIRASERAKLEKIAKWLTDNPGKRLMIAGHTDTRGTLEYNRGLGERRGLAVREYLVGLGIAQDRIFTISYGEERPAAQGDDENTHSLNRRAAPGVITK